MPLPDIASMLGLSPQTTRWYVQQVREKLGATSQSQVIRVLLGGLAAMRWERVDAPRRSPSRRH
jgi:hypothetical protein